MQKKSKKCDLKFTLRYADIEVSVDEELYTEEDKEHIQWIVDSCSKCIDIDKTYVDFKGTPYEKTFMTENGWNKFCDLVIKTKFGHKCTKSQHEILQENYSLMILCYLYQILEDYGYDCAGICLDIKQKSRYMVEIFEDNGKQVEYTGKWQTWNRDRKFKN